MLNSKEKKARFQFTSKVLSALWIGSGVLSFLLLFFKMVYPELVWLSLLLVVVLLLVLGCLVIEYQKSLKTRTAAYGLNSLVSTLLFLGIVGVLNFLVSRHPLKLDLTKNKVHTLSDQTVKLVKSLQQPVKATFFAKPQQSEQYRSILDGYKNLNSHFQLEVIDPDREVLRARQSGIKKYGTLLLSIGRKEGRVEEITEEKITNSLIKLLKEKSSVLCEITGHGEKSFSAQDADGYSTAQKSLVDQFYEIKEVNLLQSSGKGLDGCDAVAILGATKSFFEAEVTLLKAYFEKGGRGVIGLDLNPKGGEFSPELISILESWYVHPLKAMIIDPLSQMLMRDLSVSILGTFSRENPISKGFQGNCVFPFARPLEVVPGAPASLSLQWLAQTTPNSMSVTDLSQLSKGEVRFVEGKDKKGAMTAAIAVEGKQKDSKATRNTRIVVFGSSQFANNNFSRFAGNLDFFLNSVSWVLEDESLISIRAKEEDSGRIELTQKTGMFIALLTIIFIPVCIAAGGLGIWFVRRRL